MSRLPIVPTFIPMTQLHIAIVDDNQALAHALRQELLAFPELQEITIPKTLYACVKNRSRLCTVKIQIGSSILKFSISNLTFKTTTVDRMKCTSIN